MVEILRQNFELLLFVGALTAVCAGLAWTVVYYLAYAVRSQILGATIWSGNAPNNSVALTFDDGPSPDTVKILDVLREENIKATFFLIGKRVEKYPEIARRIVEENHEIGNHSYSHPIFLFCSPRRTKRELRETQEIIESVTGTAPRLARPPCGVRSPAYFAAARELGLKTVQWSDAGFDWKKISAERIARNVLETAQNNSIVLLHDGDAAGKSSRLRTVEALPLILRGLKEKGLRVAPFAQMRSEIYEDEPDANFIARSNEGEKTI